ncbi:MAG: type II toxin-antitoxin system VapC family toxin [Puniceicoccales bacterium]|jgi:predicted nucleic acid-binding protein|nr:type II toxin-antitoxin system VapC family toxin [Puniceicoccales bacterium]
MKNEAVIDASYLIEFIAFPTSERFLWLRKGHLFAPDVICYEYNNFFCNNIDRLVNVECKCNLIYSLEVQYVSILGLEEEIRRLAISNKLTFYDASYLHIAMEREIPIATYDKALIQVAKKKNMEVIG